MNRYFVTAIALLGLAPNAAISATPAANASAGASRGIVRVEIAQPDTFPDLIFNRTSSWMVEAPDTHGAFVNAVFRGRLKGEDKVGWSVSAGGQKALILAGDGSFAFRVRLANHARTSLPFVVHAPDGRTFNKRVILDTGYRKSTQQANPMRSMNAQVLPANPDEKDPLPQLKITGVSDVEAPGGPLVEIRGTFSKGFGWGLWIENSRVQMSNLGEFSLRIAPEGQEALLPFEARPPLRARTDIIKKTYRVIFSTSFVEAVESRADQARPWTFPGITVSSPSGYGASWGTVYLGGAYTVQSRVQKAFNTNKHGDAAGGFGFGFGDPEKYVGLEVSVAIESFYKGYPESPKTLVTQIPDFDSGGVSLKVHRLLENGVGLAVGYEGLIDWGDRVIPTWYGSASKVFFLREENQWFSAVTLTGGLGNGRFLPYNYILEDKGGVNIFGAAAIRVQRPISLIADWAGNSLSLAASVTPFRTFGLYLGAGLDDVAGSASYGAHATFSLGLGFSFL